jgi:hypothetical protein
MDFQSLSKSPFILPGLAWLVLPIVLAFALRRRGFFRCWGILFGLSVAADAWLNGALTPIPDGSGWATFFGVAFVILGDVRFFVVCEWDGSRLSLVRGFGLAWIVPLVSQLLRALVPTIAATPRVTFLVYEVLFLIVLAGWWLIRGHRVPMPRRAFVVRVTPFFAIQYALWASSDVLLLTTGPDIGFALRIVPDVLYYVVFVPYVLAIAPHSKREAP